MYVTVLQVIMYSSSISAHAQWIYLSASSMFNAELPMCQIGASAPSSQQGKRPSLEQTSPSVLLLPKDTQGGETKGLLFSSLSFFQALMPSKRLKELACQAL